MFGAPAIDDVSSGVQAAKVLISLFLGGRGSAGQVLGVIKRTIMFSCPSAFERDAQQSHGRHNGAW